MFSTALSSARARRRLGYGLVLGAALLVLGLLIGLSVDSLARVLVARGAGAVASGLLLVLALRMPGSVRGVWLTFWCYQALTVLADVVYDYLRLTIEEPPFPSPSDSLYLLTYGFAFAGLVLLTARISERRIIEAGIDSAVIGLALLALDGFFVILYRPSGICSG